MTIFGTVLNLLDDYEKMKKPPAITARITSSVLLIYGHVDASGGGFGESLLIRDKIHYQIGTWGRDEETNSSN